jgi:hypothetical protein
MMPRRTLPTVPRDVIPVMTYEQLDRYLGKFSSDELGLVLLLGRPGTGKSESVKRAVSVPDGTADDARRPEVRRSTSKATCSPSAFIASCGSSGIDRSFSTTSTGSTPTLTACAS